MDASSILFIGRMILVDIVRTIFIAFIVNKVILFGLSHLYAGRTNYPQVFYRNEMNIFKLLAGTQIISICLSMVLAYLLSIISMTESVLIVISTVLTYGPYIAMCFILYFGPLQALETNENGRFTIAFFYAVLACILTLFTGNIF